METEPEEPPADVLEEEEAEAPESVVHESDDLAALFAALRDVRDDEPDTEQPVDPVSAADEEATVDEEEEPSDEGIDWIEIREEATAPDNQPSVAWGQEGYDRHRQRGSRQPAHRRERRPDDSSIAESVHEELLTVWSESFAAGHSVAEQMSGSKLKRPPTPSSDAERHFASDLTSAVSSALDAAGDGTGSVSRLPPGSSGSGAATRPNGGSIRDIALAGYQAGIEESRKATTA